MNELTRLEAALDKARADFRHAMDWAEGTRNTRLAEKVAAAAAKDFRAAQAAFDRARRAEDRRAALEALSTDLSVIEMEIDSSGPAPELELERKRLIDEIGRLDAAANLH